MQWSAFSIVLGVLIIGLAVIAPENSWKNRVGLYAHGLLMFAATVGLIVSVSEIRKKTPREYSHRETHQILGLVTLSALVLNVIVGLYVLYNKIQKTQSKWVTLFHRVLGTILLLLVLATSSVAIINFYNYDASWTISIATTIGIIITVSVILKMQYTYESDKSTTKTSGNYTPVKRNIQMKPVRKSTRKKRALFI